MKILLLCNRLPFPASDGGSIAISNMAHSLVAAGHSVRMLSFNTSKHPVNIEDLPKDIIEKFDPVWILITQYASPLLFFVCFPENPIMLKDLFRKSLKTN
jgi:hypothetical protein